MTKKELLAVMRSVLSERMAVPYISQFSEDARLNEQLGLDSVLILQLLVYLELEHGLVLPEEVALQKHTGTVSALADALLQRGAA